MKRNQNTSGCALNAAQSLAQTERINAIVVRNVQRPITAENLTVKGGRSFVQCPKCNCADLKTVDSRPGDGMTRRRKECQGCGGRFTTYEITEKEYNRLKRLVAVANDPWYKEIFGNL